MVDIYYTPSWTYQPIIQKICGTVFHCDVQKKTNTIKYYRRSIYLMHQILLILINSKSVTPNSHHSFYIYVTNLYLIYITQYLTQPLIIHSTFITTTEQKKHSFSTPLITIYMVHVTQHTTSRCSTIVLPRNPRHLNSTLPLFSQWFSNMLMLLSSTIKM